MYRLLGANVAPLGMAARFSRWCAANWIIAGLSLGSFAILLITLAAISFAWWQSVRRQQQSDEFAMQSDAFAKMALNMLRDTDFAWLERPPDNRRKIILPDQGTTWK